MGRQAVAYCLADFAVSSKQTRSFCCSAETVATSVGLVSLVHIDILHCNSAPACLRRRRRRRPMACFWLRSLGLYVSYKLLFTSMQHSDALHAMQTACPTVAYTDIQLHCVSEYVSRLVCYTTWSYINRFLPRDAMLSAVYAVVMSVCVCVCVSMCLSVSYTPVLYQNG